MIDLTPLDVRKKRGDFKKGMRGYDPQEVDVFLELVAERLEALVRENIQLKDRSETLQGQVDAQTGREQAVKDALVTAQELRKDIREQSQREADHLIREAESEARRIIAEAEGEAKSRVRSVERQIDHARDSLEDLQRRRTRFLQEFRGLLQREMDVVQVEEERAPLEDRTIDLDLGAARRTAQAPRDPSSEGAAGTEAPEPEGRGVPEGGGVEDARPTPLAPPTSRGAPMESDDWEKGGDPEAGFTRAEEVEDSGEEAAFSRDEDGSRLPGRPAAPPPDVGDKPSALELELMAGAAGSGERTETGDAPEGSAPRDVPDLETVLAEAGMDEVKPPGAGEIAPPPPESSRERDPALFDEDDEGGSR